MNMPIEHVNKACLNKIKSTFHGMCIKKLSECQNILNNQLKGILGMFLQGDAPKALCFDLVIVFLSKMFQHNL